MTEQMLNIKDKMAIVFINIYFKCKLIKLSNQKKQINYIKTHNITIDYCYLIVNNT